MTYLSTVALDHFLGNVQAKACAFRTRGKKRIEYICCSLLIDTRTIVNDVDIWLIHPGIYLASNVDHHI